MLGLLWMLIIGACAGWLAGKLTHGKGFGLIKNIIIGIIGAILGGVVFRLLGFAAVGLLGELISATVGSLLLLWILQQLGKKP